MIRLVENIFYNNIVKPILSISKLGRTTVKGHADSGLNIDHMYKNRPKGVASVGRIVDKILLNLPSVKATRYKKEVIIKILTNEISNNILIGKKTKILDIASGPARYIVDFITDHNCDKVEVLCLDSDRRSINFGKILAGKKPIRYTKANVFKLKHLKAFSNKISWVPNVVISTGFFELLSNGTFKNMLEDIFRYMDNDGLAIFTSQADNPSKKLMATLGKKHNGEKWNIFFRTPEFLRELMIKIGFRDVIVSIDQWGMYEYCTGRKV